MVSAAAATVGTSPRPTASLIAEYDLYVAGLPGRDGPRHHRRRCARQFLRQHPDLARWMRRPTPTRLADLHRADAWPFVTWCFAEGHVRPDLELLLLAKPAGVDLPAAWAARFPKTSGRLSEPRKRWGGARTGPAR